MNRRMRARLYGGVGALGLVIPCYPMNGSRVKTKQSIKEFCLNE